MTIRLLCAYSNYPQNAIVTLDAGTEAGLVTAKIASTDLTGGVAYVPPTPPTQYSRASVVKDGAGAVTGIADANGARVVVISSAAPDNGDGRPDGTLYIQTAS
ncbi:hypothetical protein ACEN9F_30595 [Duganella sp. CT11-25]|uniref:hypothetical protein n=1 Tax=unclassified Duganella TaxID=2636909 RepID=UPI0039AE9A75